MNLPDQDTVNAIAGIAALVNSLMVVPSIIALRKIVQRQEATSQDHGQRIAALEKPRRKRGRV